MSIQLNLDADLAARVGKKLREIGLEWSTLPLSLQMGFLKTHITTQTDRERSLLEKVCG